MVYWESYELTKTIIMVNLDNKRRTLMIPASTAYSAVIDGKIAAKGSKKAMLRLVLAAQKDGKSAFIGVSNQAIGSVWR